VRQSPVERCCDVLFFGYGYSFTCGIGVPPVIADMMAAPPERAVRAVAHAQFADGDFTICRVARREHQKYPELSIFFTLRI
jgi:hypothetical protein